MTAARLESEIARLKEKIARHLFQISKLRKKRLRAEMRLRRERRK